ncbi:hypothetical protein [Pontibacter sp. G13]|uniref:hypothetical protein n=1 Tax=Pontibacter sp. G13 TaxID=3074898 RepID=UPI00288BAF7D|nr:hypothetical protein [Pontibacter sp. G13]WNJ18397.1 hypothetical protein RJD25_26380 [Pontibacter sp. G13]
MRFLTILLAGICCVQISWAQKTGHVNYSNLGIEFDLPPGWTGQEGDGMLVVGNPSVTGGILMMVHAYSLQELIRETRNGISEGEGNNLQLASEVARLGDHAIECQLSGVLNWQPAYAHMISMENPHGMGITILGISDQGNFDPNFFQQLCRTIYQSVRFKKPVKSQQSKEWETALANARLTYMDSYYSGGYGEGAVGGGYSTRITIDLCGGKYFKYRMNDQVSAGGASSTAMNSSQGRGQGTWEVMDNAAGGSVLVLSFHNGEVLMHDIGYQNDELYLSGERYYLTRGGEYAADCP